MAGVFGIHVGNSSACLAYCKDGKVDIIADDSGNRIMPAIVAFVDGEETVGLPAKAALVRNAACTIVRNKKLLNDRIPDDELENHIKSVKCKIVTEGGLKYEIRDEDKIVVYTPEGAMTCIYKKLFGFASTCVPPDTDLRTVLCVPLNFSKYSRQALARAAEDAGFDVLQVISEPVAALLAQGYGVESPDERGMCLVYRLGGATMDVTIVLCCAGMYTVKGHVYKPNFGGDKFTEILATFLAEVFHQKWKLDPNDSRRAMAKLYNSSEQCKHILSTMSTAHCFIESLCEGTDFSYNVTRARFENLISAAVKMCTAPIEEALSQAGIHYREINKVLLCGGSAKIPLIQQSVSEMFPNSELLCSVNPDELIALGAAKHGCYLKEPFDPGCDHLSYDIPVVTKSIFMKANDDKVLVIPSQTPVPVKVTKSLPFTISGESVLVQVWEADDDDDDDDDDEANVDDDERVASDSSEEDNLSDLKQDSESDDDSSAKGNEKKNSEKKSSSQQPNQTNAQKSTVKQNINNIKDILMERKKLMEKAREELPYTFKVPDSYDDLQNTLSHWGLDHQTVIIERMLKCNHPSLAEGNREKLQELLKFLLQHINDSAIPDEDQQSPQCFSVLDRLIPHIYDLTHMSPVSAGQSVLEVIKEKQTDFRNSKRTYPGCDTLVFLKLVSHLFPTSDFRHPVITPTIIFMEQILWESRIQSRRDVATGLFITTLLLEYSVLSKRFSPAAVNFLCGVLYLSVDKSAYKSVRPVPPFKSKGEASGLLILSEDFKTEDFVANHKMNLSDLLEDATIDDNFKIRALWTSVKLLSAFQQNLEPLASSFEIFKPVSVLINHLNTEQFPPDLKDDISNLHDKIEKMSVKKICHLIFEKKKPKALRLYEPKVEQVFDCKRRRPMGPEKQEREKLLHKYRRELKGAVREIRRDRAFLTKVKLKQTLKSDLERKEKVKEIFGSAAMQQGELNLLKRKKEAGRRH